MKRWYALFFLLASFVLIPTSFSQEEPIKVIPIGETIKPEGKTEQKPAPAPQPTTPQKTETCSNLGQGGRELYGGVADCAQ